MTVAVKLKGGATEKFEDPEDKYEEKTNGTLVVRRADGTETTFARGAWISVGGDRYRRPGGGLGTISTTRDG